MKKKITISVFILIILVSTRAFTAILKADKTTYKTVSFMGKEYKTIFKETYEDKKVYIYDNNIEFIFDEDKLIGYFDPTIIKDIDNAKSMDELTKISSKYLDAFSNMRSDKYTLIEPTYYETYNIYTFNYTYMYNGISTSDSITVQLRPDGSLYSLSAPRVALFDSLNTIINDDDINMLIKKDVTEEYSIANKMYIFKDKNYYLEVDVLFDKNPDKVVSTAELFYKVGEDI